MQVEDAGLCAVGKEHRFALADYHAESEYRSKIGHHGFKQWLVACS